MGSRKIITLVKRKTGASHVHTFLSDDGSALYARVDRTHEVTPKLLEALGAEEYYPQENTFMFVGSGSDTKNKKYKCRLCPYIVGEGESRKTHLVAVHNYDAQRDGTIIGYFD